MNKLVSVIVPIYKTEKYLSECIESIIDQTYKNIEVILVNDGSPGNADEICKKYTEKDSRIKYIKKENEGAAIARNVGIENAVGDFICCVDSDDTISATFIEEIFNTFIKNQCDLLVIGSQFNDNVNALGCLPTCGFAVKKELLDKYPDVRFPAGIMPCEDGLFSHKLIALTDKIAKLNSTGYNYRQNSESSEHNLNANKMLNDIPKWFEILTDFYNKYDLWDTKKQHILSFIHIEPFNRLNTLKLNFSQKNFLTNLMLNFIKEHNLNSGIDTNLYMKKFNYFINSKSYLNYYITYRVNKFFGR